MVKILVVEDTPSELRLVTHILDENGYIVIGAADASIALNKVIEQKPDVVVTDVVMPGMSGFELCRRLKNNLETKRLPVIICSSKSKEIDRLWAMKQGADIYLTKPFTREQLVRAVKSVAA